jgi:hypothetical protein
VRDATTLTELLSQRGVDVVTTAQPAPAQR